MMCFGMGLDTAQFNAPRIAAAEDVAAAVPAAEAAFAAAAPLAAEVNRTAVSPIVEERKDPSHQKSEKSNVPSERSRKFIDPSLSAHLFDGPFVGSFQDFWPTPWDDLSLEKVELGRIRDRSGSVPMAVSGPRTLRRVWRRGY